MVADRVVRLAQVGPDPELGGDGRSWSYAVRLGDDARSLDCAVHGGDEDQVWAGREADALGLDAAGVR